jgi:hypothetical protein
MMEIFLLTMAVIHALQFTLLLLALSSQIPSCICLGTWTWMYGEKTINSSGVYGEIGVPSPFNIPSARCLAASSYVNNSNTLWLFGGSYGTGKI